MTTSQDAANQAQYLTFRIADEEYGVGVLRVKEIIEYDTLTKLPSAPTHIRGVINLRGSVVPVVDLGVQIGIGERSVTKRTCIIILEVEQEGEHVVMGIVVDAVNQVIDLPPGEIEPPPSFGTRMRMDLLRGMGKLGKRFVLLLEIDHLLGGETLTQAVAALPAAAESPVTA